MRRCYFTLVFLIPGSFYNKMELKTTNSSLLMKRYSDIANRLNFQNYGSIINRQGLVNAD